MAHYAFLDNNFIVTNVIVGKDENEDGVDWELHYARVKGQMCKRTSFNTREGIHREGGTPFRKNFAGVGFYYNQSLDAFIPPKPYASWVLNEDKGVYEAPVSKPDDGKIYYWDENTTNWVAEE